MRSMSNAYAIEKRIPTLNAVEVFSRESLDEFCQKGRSDQKPAVKLSAGAVERNSPKSLYLAN